VQRKAASALGLVGFAVVAAVGALRGLDFGTALGRSVLAGVLMCLVGYVAGFIADRALSEAVDARMPLHPEPRIEDITQATAPKKEEPK